MQIDKAQKANEIAAKLPNFDSSPAEIAAAGEEEELYNLKPLKSLRRDGAAKKRLLQQKSSYLSDAEGLSSDEESKTEANREDKEIVDKFLKQVVTENVSEMCDEADKNEDGSPAHDGFGFIAGDVARKSVKKLPFVDQAVTKMDEQVFVTAKDNIRKQEEASEDSYFMSTGAKSASTHEDSDMVKGMKQRKILHYRPSLELDDNAKACYYADLVANSVNHKTDRVLQKCNDTLRKIEEMQSRNKHLSNASAQIEQLTSRF